MPPKVRTPDAANAHSMVCHRDFCGQNGRAVSAAEATRHLEWFAVPGEVLLRNIDDRFFPDRLDLPPFGETARISVRVRGQRTLQRIDLPRGEFAERESMTAALRAVALRCAEHVRVGNEVRLRPVFACF